MSHEGLEDDTYIEITSKTVGFFLKFLIVMPITNKGNAYLPYTLQKVYPDIILFVA